MKTSYLFILVILLSLTFISAEGFFTPAVKNYDSVEKVVSVKNSILGFITTSTVADLKLNTPIHNRVLDDGNRSTKELVASIDISSYMDYNQALKQLNFYKYGTTYNDGTKQVRDFEYRYKTIEGKITVNDYSDVCKGTGEFYKGNTTEIFKCTNEIVGTHQEDNVVWKTLDSNIIPRGNFTIGIFTDVISGEKVEWIPQDWYGVKISEWADFEGYTKYEYDVVSGSGSTVQSAYSFAQTFTVGVVGANVTYNITGFNIFLRSLVGNPNVDVVIQDVNEATNVPNSTIFASNTTWNSSEVSGGVTAVSVNITGFNFKVVKGKRYALVLRFVGGATSFFWQGGTGAGANYAGGEQFYADPANSDNWAPEGKDMRFEVYGLLDAGDATYPKFSNSYIEPRNDTQFRPNRNYNFNITIIDTNGTAGIEFNGTNYTMRNVTEIFNRSFSGLTQGVYSYYFWSYGNGSSTLFNRSIDYKYTIPSIKWAEIRTFDNYADGVVNDLWVNTSSSIAAGSCAISESASDYIENYCTVSGGAGGTVSTTLRSASMDIEGRGLSINDIKSYNENFTIGVYLSANSPACCGTGLSEATFDAFGQNVKTISSNGAGTTTDDSLWTFKKNGTTYLVYNDGVYEKTITPTTGYAYFYIINSATTGGGGSQVQSTGRFHTLNYTFFNATMTTTKTAVADAINVENITFTTTINSTLNELNNISIFIDGKRNETKTITGFTNSTTFNQILEAGYHNYTILGCDLKNCKFEPTLDYPTGVFENSHTYNTSIYDTKYESFVLNMSFNNNTFSVESARLVLNGTSYTGTVTSAGAGYAIVTSSNILIPTGVMGNWSVLWNVTLLNLTGSPSYFSTTPSNTSFKPIIFGLCNDTLTTKYINYTFKDESTDAAMNGTINLWTMYYGINNRSKTFLYTNLSLDNPSYAFCFYPPDKTILQESAYVQYSYTGYPQRQYYSINDMSNITSNQLLYLLGSTSGIYSSIQTANNVGNPITGVTVQVERQFSGVWTVIGQAVTDSSGLATFWLNPNYDHRFTATKTGYATNTVTIRPTQSVYTIIMSTGTANATFISQVEGVSYTRSPSSGIINIGSHLFIYNITSSRGNMANCKFELVYYNGSVIAMNSSACSSNAYLTLTRNIASGQVIYGRYYVDMGAGYLLLESDGNWRSIASNGSSAGTLISFLKLLGDRSAWGVVDNVTSCHRMIYNGDLTCENYATQVLCEADATCFWGESDDNRRWEFTMIVMVFFIIAILGAATNVGFSYDLYNPGYFLWIVSFLLLGISIAGQVDSLTNPQGLLYIQGATFLPFFDNYIIAIYAFIITGIITLRSGRGA